METFGESPETSPGRGRSVVVAALVLALLLPMARSPAHAVSSDAQVLSAIGKGIQWLAARQQNDGSWGTTSSEKWLHTTEAVRALQSANVLGPDYLAGVVWLENHRPPNSDFAARRLLSLAPNKDTLTVDRSALAAAKAGAVPGITLAGWGVTGDYRADPLDTALATLALGLNNPTFYPSNTDAFAGFAETVVSSTWTIALPQAPPAFGGDLPSTVAVASAIRACAAIGVSQCSLMAQNTLPSVETKLVAYASTTTLERGLIAGYFAPLRDALPPAISLAQLGTMIDALVSQQHVGGSWDVDALSTTTALQALARWLRLERPDAGTPVALPNAALRAAVNRALGQHAMDMVTRGDLWRLTSLDLSYASVPADLSALTEASNLTTIDVSGNPCVLAIPNLATLLQVWFPNATIKMFPVGDLNRDNVTNAYDLHRLVAQLMDRQALPLRRAGDINFDGQVDARDLYWLDRLLLKQDVAALCR